MDSLNNFTSPIEDIDITEIQSAILSGKIQYEQEDLATPISDIAPDLTLYDVSGNSYQFEDLNVGKVGSRDQAPLSFLMMVSFLTCI